MYLLHVGRDPYWRNTPVAGPRPQLNREQPLSLNLLSAHGLARHRLRQRAAGHDHRAVGHPPPANREPDCAEGSALASLPKGEFVVSIEADTIEEMSRLWQAFTVPMRLSALIKARVVFVAPAASRRHRPPSRRLSSTSSAGPMPISTTRPTGRPSRFRFYGRKACKFVRFPREIRAGHCFRSGSHL